jgi:hypothetical protein
MINHKPSTPSTNSSVFKARKRVLRNLQVYKKFHQRIICQAYKLMDHLSPFPGASTIDYKELLLYVVGKPRSDIDY